MADPSLGILTGLQTQVTGYWADSHGTADSNALYVVGIGGNDLSGIAAALPGISPADYAARQAAAQTVVGNLVFSLNFLIDRGARNFLIANAPNLGVTPVANAAGFQLAATDASRQYNILLSSALAALGGAPKVVEFDLFGLISDLVADAQAGGPTYGLGNGVIPCMAALETCNDSVFFDPLHPTARVHAMAGEAALALLASQAVPEPKSSLLLIFTALLLALIFSRRRPDSEPRPSLPPIVA